VDLIAMKAIPVNKQEVERLKQLEITIAQEEAATKSRKPMQR